MELYDTARRAIVPFEPNDPNTWETLEDMVRSFLEKLQGMGMFAGGKPEESFYVKCDEETNPPDAVDNGQLICEVGVAPAIPAEFIVIRVVENME